MLVKRFQQVRVVPTLAAGQKEPLTMSQGLNGKAAALECADSHAVKPRIPTRIPRRSELFIGVSPSDYACSLKRESCRRRLLRSGCAIVRKRLL
ncbi:MAG: hypothetical protein M3O15_15370, partial [Acidobacteriota bacterium]|nr:hypothetical protein [Acidobacteriota bacterium]